MPIRILLLACGLLPVLHAVQPYFDRTHASKVLGEERHYRIYLPPDYETSGRAYPVIYYFHGSADRYTLAKYDDGKDTSPKIADYVAHHPVIVVAVDGYVAKYYPGFYGGAPWDISQTGGDYDFGAYWKELVAHIDGTYRTLASRRYRATSGLSMGGFMSLWLSARYPDRIGSASAFNPGPEFYVGEKDARSLWRPKDQIPNHTHTMIRLIRASGDYISQYHEETRDAYARAQNVDFEFRQDEYHRHWATSIGETFDFHARAFRHPELDNPPESFNHSDAYRNFEAWGYRVESSGGAGPCITYLDGVTQGGFRLTTRRWAPDGPAEAARRISITTPALYRPGERYRIIDYEFSTGRTRTSEQAAGRDGRLSLSFDGAGHQVSFAGPGTGGELPVLLPVTRRERLIVEPGREVALPVRIYNPRGTAMADLSVALSSDYPTVQVVGGSFQIPKLESGAVADSAGRLKARFTAGSGYLARTRLKLTIAYDGYHQSAQDLDVMVAPEIAPAPAAIEVLDGRTVTLPVFRQKGNQGGGGSIQRTVTEGKGNGNGVLEPGEEATIWVKMVQGMDPFDKNNWYRTKIYFDSPYLEEVADLQEQKQLEWTSAKERTSVVRLSEKTPAGTSIPLLLDNESWSYWFTPDVRYGVERLYQAYQFHTHHLHRYELKVR